MEEIKKHVSENQVLKEAWSNNLEEYFDNLIDMFTEGKLSECFDVEGISSMERTSMDSASG